MLLRIFMLAALLPMMLGGADALDTTGEWKVFLNALLPEPCDRLPAELEGTAKGARVKPKTLRMSGHTIDLAALAGSFHAGAEAVLYYEFHREQAGEIRAGAAADWWMEVFVNGKLAVSTMRLGNRVEITPEAHVFTVPVRAGKNLLVARVRSGSEGWRFVLGTPKPPQANLVFTANGEWKVADMAESAVRPGSALDQTALSELPGKALPRLGMSARGKLIVEGRPDWPVRLRGTGSHTTWLFNHAKRTPGWKELWKKDAEQARLQGYNLVRLWADSMCTTEDLTFTPDLLDRLDYFIAVLAERQVYTFLTVGSYGLYRKAKYWDKPAPGERLDYKLRMYLGDPEIRHSWKIGVETLMNHVNPYTGRAWKDEPAIACVELYNEQEWGLLRPHQQSPQTLAEFSEVFRAWLKKKYKSLDALALAWGGTAPKSWGEIEVPATFPIGSKSVRDNDFILLTTDLSRECARWMNETLRATGYRGLVPQYNLSRWFGGQAARWEEAQVSISNTYFNHPSNFDRPGSRCRQNSSIEASAAYWRDVAVMRFADRPLIVTEYNHPFWNRYQYEGGLLFGAYSALQGFDGLMVHDEAVFDHVVKGLDCFGVARSPVLRAGEFVLACLFQRGDVKPSPHRVELSVPKEYVEQGGNGALSVSWEQNKLALLTGFSVGFTGLKPAAGTGLSAPADWVIAPDGGSILKSAGGGWAVEGVEKKGGRFSAGGAVKELKAKGLLPADNLSDPARGVYQSDTGEITMRVRDRVLKVVTPRSEAAALPENREEALGCLRILGSSVPAMVAACSTDGKPLADSGRIVLVYSTRAANSGMELSADEVTLLKLGQPPVLLQTGRLKVELAHSQATGMRLYALGFDGVRREELPLSKRGETLEISLDTALLKNGPTVFFELTKGE